LDCAAHQTPLAHVKAPEGIDVRTEPSLPRQDREEGGGKQRTGRICL